MRIRLKEAHISDATAIQRMYKMAFKNLYLKYHDDDTNPYMETIKSIKNKITAPASNFYFIKSNENTVGLVRLQKENNIVRISPLLILPKFQGKHLAQDTLNYIEQMNTNSRIELDTIAQEKKLIHLYTKSGYTIDSTKHINLQPGMDLIFFYKNT